MAADFYLQIDGIKGESADSEHVGWIECTSVRWSITQPKSATASTAGGHTAERAELTDIVIHKLIDLASPMLAQACASGKTFPKAVVEFFRADGNGTRVKFFRLELDNVLVGHIAPVFGSGDFPNESLGLKYSKARWVYTQQKISGGGSGNTSGSWNLATNRIG